MCSSVLQYVAESAVCCSVLQRVAVCGSVLQCVTVCCSVVQCDTSEATQKRTIHTTKEAEMYYERDLLYKCDKDLYIQQKGFQP